MNTFFDTNAPLPLPVVPLPDPTEATPRGFWDSTVATFDKRTVEGDKFFYEQRIRNDKILTLFHMLPRDAGLEALTRVDRETRERGQANWPAIVFDAAAKQAHLDPGRWQGQPLDADALDRYVTERQTREVAEADRMLARPAGAAGIAGQLAGGFARETADPITLATLLVAPEGSLARVVGVNALVNGLADLAHYPAEARVAEKLGLEKPDPAQMFLGGAFVGGALGGLAHGLTKVPAAAARFARTLKGVRESVAGALPKGVSALDHDAALAAADGTLSASGTPLAQSLDETRYIVRPGAPVQAGDFDFAEGGTAYWRTNGIGFMAGQLLARGLTPEEAAAVIGNAMVESGVSLNPAALGDGGNALGYFQWNDRRPLLLQEAARQGKSPTDPHLQLDYLFKELNGSEAAAWAKVRAAGTVEEKALAFSQHFERPGEPHNDLRMAYARDIYNQMMAGRVPKWQGRVPPLSQEAAVLADLPRAGRGATSAVRPGEAVARDPEGLAYETVAARHVAAPEAPAGRPHDEPAPVPVVPLAETASDPTPLADAARRQDPEVFAEADRLTARIESYRRWIDDLGQLRDEAQSAPQAKLLAERAALAEQLGTMTTGGRRVVRDRLKAIDAEIANLPPVAARRDSPDMARVRSALMADTHALHDLGPRLRAARKAAEADAGTSPRPADARAATASAEASPKSPTPAADGLRSMPLSATDPVPPALPAGAYAEGAQGAEAIAADRAVLDRLADPLSDIGFGPVIGDFKGNWQEAVEALKRGKGGEAFNALSYPEIDGGISLVWGEPGTGHHDGFGLSKILTYHPEILDDLQGRLSAAKVVSSSSNRMKLESERDEFSIRREFNGNKRNWLLTGYEKQPAAERRTMRSGAEATGSSPADQLSPKGKGQPAENQPARSEWAQEIAAAKAVAGDLSLRLPDGTDVRMADLLDDIEGDQSLVEVLDACNPGGRA